MIPLGAGVLVLSLAATTATSHERPHPRLQTLTKRTWGVEVLGVRRVAAGHMLEFRYHVLDPKKAQPLFVRKSKPLLIDRKSGAALEVPRPPTTGALRNSDLPLANHDYWMLFVNPGGFVRPGNEVSVVIGEFRVDGLVVE